MFIFLTSDHGSIKKYSDDTTLLYSMIKPIWRYLKWICQSIDWNPSKVTPILCSASERAVNMWCVLVRAFEINFSQTVQTWLLCSVSSKRRRHEVQCLDLTQRFRELLCKKGKCDQICAGISLSKLGVKPNAKTRFQNIAVAWAISYMITLWIHLNTKWTAETVKHQARGLLQSYICLTVKYFMLEEF